MCTNFSQGICHDPAGPALHTEQSAASRRLVRALQNSAQPSRSPKLFRAEKGFPQHSKTGGGICKVAQSRARPPQGICRPVPGRAALVIPQGSGRLLQTEHIHSRSRAAHPPCHGHLAMSGISSQWHLPGTTIAVVGAVTQLLCPQRMSLRQSPGATTAAFLVILTQRRGVGTSASKEGCQVVGRSLERALLRPEVHIDDAKLLRVADGPLPVGEQAPCKVACHGHLHPQTGCETGCQQCWPGSQRPLWLGSDWYHALHANLPCIPVLCAICSTASVAAFKRSLLSRQSGAISLRAMERQQRALSCSTASVAALM